MSRLLEPVIRTVFAGIVAVLVYWFMPTEVLWQTRLMLAWDVGILLLLTLVAIMMHRADPEQTRHRAQTEEPHSIVIVLMVIVSAVSGMGAVVMTSDDMQGWSASQMHAHTAIALLGAFGSWVWIHVYFGLYYARKYYDEVAGAAQGSFAKGLQFPHAEVVDYWDFLYYSFTIAMCYQTSDVTIDSPTMRRLTILHSVLSFFFVTLIIGLVVNSISNIM